MFNVAKMLSANGHRVAFFSMQHNENAASEWNKYFTKNVDYGKESGITENIKNAVKILYSREAEEKLLRLATDFNPDVAHLHNYHHQLSPSIIHALNKSNIPIVAKLSDYKIVCPSYHMLNHEKTCNLCKGRRFYKCFLTKCHKNSYAKSLTVTLEQYLHHNIMKSYDHIGYFICPSRFIMDKCREMGFKGNFAYLPNFVERVDTVKFGKDCNHRKIVYTGRLSHEKGLNTLVNAIKESQAELDIVGDGPLKNSITRRIERENIGNVHLSGHLTGQKLLNKIREGIATVLPSEWYENNPNSILESFSLGKPAIGSRIGGIPELIKDGETGFLFKPGDSADLRDKIESLLNNPEKAVQMGKNARDFVERVYNAETHLEHLMEIYKNAISK